MSNMGAWYLRLKGILSVLTPGPEQFSVVLIEQAQRFKADPAVVKVELLNLREELQSYLETINLGISICDEGIETIGRELIK